jgi:hypothetical protein
MGQERHDWNDADAYERRAYERLIAEVNKPSTRYARAAGRLSESVGGAARRVAERLPNRVTDVADDALRTAMDGLRDLTLEPAMRSVRFELVAAAYANAGHEVASLDEVQVLPLRVIDDVMPGLRWRYAAGTAAEGAVAGAVISGGELLATFGSVAGAGAGAAPGGGAIVSAMAVDAATVVGAMARVVAHVGAYHGYDCRRAEESLFALSVINWSSAGTSAAKVEAYLALSKLTQQLARSATWAVLGEHVLVQAIQKLYARLGVRLTQRKLGQLVPVAGITIGAGMNAAILSKVAADALTAYRVRYFVEKYGLDPLDLMTQEDRSAATSSGEADLDVVGLLEGAATDGEG